MQERATSQRWRSAPNRFSHSYTDFRPSRFIFSIDCYQPATDYSSLTAFFLRLGLLRFHLLSRPFIFNHQNLGDDTYRDLLRRFGVQLESHWRMDLGELFLGYTFFL